MLHRRSLWELLISYKMFHFLYRNPCLFYIAFLLGIPRVQPVTLVYFEPFSWMPKSINLVQFSYTRQQCIGINVNGKVDSLRGDGFIDIYWPAGGRWAQITHVSVAWPTCRLSLLYNSPECDDGTCKVRVSHRHHLKKSDLKLIPWDPGVMGWSRREMAICQLHGWRMHRFWSGQVASWIVFISLFLSLMIYAVLKNNSLIQRRPALSWREAVCCRGNTHSHLHVARRDWR